MTPIQEKKQQIEQLFNQFNALNQDLANVTKVVGEGFSIHGAYEVDSKELTAVLSSESLENEAAVFSIEQLRQLHGKIAEFLQKIAQ